MRHAESIRAQQIRAARALLNWSQDDLVKATGISVATIRRLEAGYISPRNATTTLIRDCLENAGIEFLEFDGVRRRQNGISVFEGAYGGQDFFEDVKQTTQKSGSDVLIVTPTTEAFAKFCGISGILDMESLMEFSQSVEIKCLVTEEFDVPISTPRFQFRTISKNFVDPVPFCVYGQKYGIAVPNGEPFCKLVIVDAPKMALLARHHFASLWEKSAQTVISIDKKMRCAANQ